MYGICRQPLTQLLYHGELQTPPQVSFMVTLRYSSTEWWKFCWTLQYFWYCRANYFFPLSCFGLITFSSRVICHWKWQLNYFFHPWWTTTSTLGSNAVLSPGSRDSITNWLAKTAGLAGLEAYFFVGRKRRTLPQWVIKRARISWTYKK